MVICFVAECSHRTCRELCSFRRFPKNQRECNKWENLCRRADRRLNHYDRICSCHFLRGQTRPSVFPWSKQQYVDISTLERILRRMKLNEEIARQAQLKEMETKEVKMQIDDTVLEDHTYTLPRECREMIEQKIQLIERKDRHISQLKAEVQNLERKVKLLQLQPRQTPLSIKRIKHNEKKMLLYTSLPYDVFKIIADALSRFELTYYEGWNVTCLAKDDQLLLTFVKLRLNSKDLDLGDRFGVSDKTVSNVFNTYIHALHELLFEGILSGYIPSQLKCKSCMPAAFSEFSSARLVMDATEVTMDIPQKLDKKALTYSSYKSRHTVKSVLSVAPNAAIVHVSDLYPGSTSDNAIVQHCGVLTQLKPGDMILADKGFTIQKMLPSEVQLNIPPFLSGKAQFTPQEAQLAYKIARARIHVERANERLKNFAILNHIPAHYRPVATKIFQVCAVLVNLQAPLLKEIERNHPPN